MIIQFAYDQEFCTTAVECHCSVGIFHRRKICKCNQNQVGNNLAAYLFDQELCNISKNLNRMALFQNF